MECGEKGESRMNYKVLGILVVLLVVGLTVQPVASMWNNGNWLPDDSNAKCDNVVFNSESGVTSCIKNTVPESSPVSGHLYIMTLTHHSLIGSAFTIQRVDPSGVQFTNGALVQKEILDKMKILAEPREFALDRTGGWDDDLAEGTFFITLKDGNGGQPEYALVTITKGYPFYVVFKGHAVSSAAVEEISKPMCPQAKPAGWNLGYLVPFRLEKTTPPMWVQVQTTITGKTCTKTFLGFCTKWSTEPSSQTQTQWHLSEWINHVNVANDRFKPGSLIEATTISCKPLSCGDYSDTDTSPS